MGIPFSGSLRRKFPRAKRKRNQQLFNLTPGSEFLSFVGYLNLSFDRQHNLTLDFSQPPYYAVKTQPGIQVTLGGIDVNNNMQVIKKDGGFSQIFTQQEKLLMTDHLDRDRRQSDFIKVILRHKTSLENLTDS